MTTLHTLGIPSVSVTKQYTAYCITAMELFHWWSVSIIVQTGSGCFSVQSQIRQQEEVEKKAEVAMEMSDLVVYCQPRSKEKDRFGKHMQTRIYCTQKSQSHLCNL